MNANVCSPNSGIISGNRPRPLSFCALKFAADRWLPIVAISMAVLLPCFWHQHIEAGDLASHTYNAWLAQLIARGDAPGLYLVRQWNNVLVDVALAKLGGSVGFAAADKIVVSACVLIFFWGAFAFIAAATWRPPWFLIPAVAMIAYGWTFQMGFMNYYLSLGFAFFATALFWRGQAVDWLAALALSGLALMAHPMGFFSLVAMVVYIQLAEKGSGWYRWMVFASALLAVLALHWYIVRHFRVAYWDTAFFYLLNGADQLILYGNRYLIPTWIALIFGSVCFIHGRVQQRKRSEPVWSFRIALELWAILLFVAAMIPELIYLPWYAAPIGFPVARLTAVTGILGLCILGSVQPRSWHLIGLGVCAAIFFSFLYGDTGTLNRMEDQVGEMTKTLPYGRRVIETIAAPRDSRVPFINHIVDRACIGRCFTYSNYEPASGQFRIRVRPDSPVATDSADSAQAMEDGKYVVRPQDLPMTQIEQCGGNDLTRLCMRDLSAGEKNGSHGSRSSFPQ
jgi:MFS family permease